MNKNFIVICFVLSELVTFSQKRKESYYFDCVTYSKLKSYVHNLDRNDISFTNSKDSTYRLSLCYDKKLNYAILCDYKKKQLVKFDLNFDYKNINDLINLRNSKLYTNVIIEKPKYKNCVKEFSLEKDSVNNKNIVRLIYYKNKKKKKIVSENYYFFSSNKKNQNFYNEKLKNYILKICNLNELKDLFLEKILIIFNGKIESESEYIESNTIDYLFKFDIDEVNPKAFEFSVE